MKVTNRLGQIIDFPIGHFDPDIAAIVDGSFPECDPQAFYTAYEAELERRRA